MDILSYFVHNCNPIFSSILITATLGHNLLGDVLGNLHITVGLHGVLSRTPSTPASPAARASTATSRSVWSPTSPARATCSRTHGLQDDGVLLVAEGVAGGGVLQTDDGGDVAGVHSLDILPVGHPRHPGRQPRHRGGGRAPRFRRSPLLPSSSFCTPLFL